jgi:hypothetical protein
MNPHSEIPFAESKQERSQKTLEDILQAAEEIVAGSDPDLFTSRTLSQKSGYALGTLVRRLGSIENVFLRAAKNRRDQKFKEIALAIAQFDANTPVHEFAENMVERTFTGFQLNNPKVMRFFESRFTKMNGLPPDYFTYMDFIVDPYLKASHLNKTNTFRRLSKNEAALLLRQLCLLAERPFMEDSPIAGTEEHRKIVMDAIIRLLGK